MLSYGSRVGKFTSSTSNATRASDGTNSGTTRLLRNGKERSQGPVLRIAQFEFRGTLPKHNLLLESQDEFDHNANRPNECSNHRRENPLEIFGGIGNVVRQSDHCSG